MALCIDGAKNEVNCDARQWAKSYYKTFRTFLQLSFYSPISVHYQQFFYNPSISSLKHSVKIP